MLRNVLYGKNLRNGRGDSIILYVRRGEND